MFGFVELPGIRVIRISRDGRWIAGIDFATSQGVLIPTEELLANPGDTSYYEYLPDEQVNDFRGFSDDNNIVLATISTAVPESSSEVSASALYDRTHQTWHIKGQIEQGGGDSFEKNVLKSFSQRVAIQLTKYFYAHPEKKP